MSINWRELRKAYKKADSELQKLLEASFGADKFSGSVMDRVKTLRDACDEIGKDYEAEFGPERTKHETLDETAYREWKVIAEALNEGVEIDFSNPNQYKYYPWMKWSSGRGLSLDAVLFAYSSTDVGPRLCFTSEEKCIYAVKQFPDTFHMYFNYLKK